MKFTPHLAAVLLGAAAFSMPSQTALGQNAAEYLQSMSGSWRGGGSVRINEQGKKVRVNCRSRNSFSRGSRSLKISGRCASSQGTENLNGTIRFSADGRTVTTGSLSFGGRGSAARASLNGGVLMLTGSIKNDEGETVRTRARIRGGGKSYTISLSANTGSGFKPAGQLTFRK